MVYINYKGNNSFFSIKDEYGRVRNHIFFVVARTGYGKGLFAERILEAYHSAGYTVICIADPKDEQEMAYAFFNPIESYHTKTLRITGKPTQAFTLGSGNKINLISNKKVKLYHPFSFNLPKHKIPEMNIYTIPFKSLGRGEWGLIAESSYDTDTIKLCMNASNNISKDAGIYDFLHYLQNIIKGKKDRREITPDPKNFYLSATSGTTKSLQDIANYLQPFKKDYFLSRETSPHKLNWPQILNDKEHYHIFLNSWAGIKPKDNKIKSFLILYTLNKIIENIHKAKNPVIIFVPEIKFLMPFKPKGYQEFLAISMKESLSMCRSQGKGVSVVLDTQVYGDCDESVRRTSSRMFLGELTPDDIEKIGKALQYGKDTKKLLSDMGDPNCYIWVGRHDIGTIRMFLPSHMHCEEDYNFYKMFEEKYPDKMKNYSSMIGEMQREMDRDHKKFAEIIKKKKEQQKRKREKEEAEKDKKKSETEKKQTRKAKEKETKDILKDEMMKIVYEFKQENPDASGRVLLERFGDRFNIRDHKTLLRWVKEYKTKLEKEKKEEESKDFVDNFLEDKNPEDKQAQEPTAPETERIIENTQ